MQHPHLMFLMLAVIAGTAARAQDNPGEEKHPCTLLPIFHCVEARDDGGAVGHFGYDLQCPKDLDDVQELIVPIGEDNNFSPDPVDRGQTIIFIPGKHGDEFEAKFTADEIKQARDIQWSVNKISTTVDFSKTRDEDLDCRHLPDSQARSQRQQ